MYHIIVYGLSGWQLFNATFGAEDLPTVLEIVAVTIQRYSEELGTSGEPMRVELRRVS